MKQTKISFNMDGLDQLLKEVDGKYVTRVGVLGSDGARSDGDALGNAEIGIVHEFGSISKNIPERSFLRLPLQLKAKDFIKSLREGFSKHMLETGQFKKFHELMGIKAEAIIQDGFATGGFGHWPELSEKTIEKKGSSTPLIDSAQLRRSVTSDVVNSSEIN